MDWSLIEQKLESLRRATSRVVEHCPEDVATLARDYDAQDIVSVNLTRAVQLSVDIANHVLSESDLPSPVTMGQSFDLLQEQGIIDAALCERMKKAVGFRDLAVHNYDTIDCPGSTSAAIAFFVTLERSSLFSQQAIKLTS